MTLASSSLVNVRAIKEVTFGVTPASGNPTVLRVTSESLSYDLSKKASDEISSKRTVSSMQTIDASVTGGLGQEIHYAGIEPFLESTLQSAFSEFGTDGLGVATATTSITTTEITAASATSSTSIFTNLKKGQWFRITSAGVNNGKILRVSTVTGPTTTVITLDASTPAAASTSESIQVQTARLTHGATQTSWTIERENSDIGVFMAFKGCTPSKLSMKVASGSLSTINFDFMGQSALEGTATTLPGTPVAAPTYDIHSGVIGATNAVWMDGVPVSGTYVKSVSLDFDNSLRSQGALGVLGAAAIGAGTISCKASVEIYFANKDLFTKYRNNTNSSLIFATTDSSGNGYIVTLPVCSIESWKSNAGGKDQDQMISVSLMALSDDSNADATLRKAIFFDRVGAAIV